jgi:hypothetical protein
MAMHLSVRSMVESHVVPTHHHPVLIIHLPLILHLVPLVVHVLWLLSLVVHIASVTLGSIHVLVLLELSLVTHRQHYLVTP